MYGTLAAFLLFGIYLIVLTLVSGWSYALEQFYDYWYFISSLAAGFGVQIGLYRYLVHLVQHSKGNGVVVGVTGTTSTAAMISCCTHYLANILPLIGTIGLVTFVAQYQVELFWVGVLFNLMGIGFLLYRINKIRRP